MDKAINVGLYDTLYECSCGYRYIQSIDSSDQENTDRKEHNCETHTHAQS